MQIIWHGQACFSLKGKNAVIVTDPYSEEIGLKLPKLEADIVTVSHQHFDHNNTAAVSGQPKIFEWPGEYETKEIVITGIEAFHFSESEGKEGEKRGKIIIFCFELDGLKICHLGDLGHRLTSGLTEAIGEVDVLFIPVGGIYTIGAEKAHEVIEQIEPRLVIPMHYKIPGLKIDLAPLEDFLKEIGLKNPEEKEVLKISKSDLSEEKTEYVIMKPVTS